MWYFIWILGMGLALGFGIINVMWLEANCALGKRDENRTRERFERARQMRGSQESSSAEPA